MTTSRRHPTTHRIPAAAWRHEMGAELENAGRSRVTHETLIDDGPWGGAPLGGIGSGSIGRTPRGDFARWHLDIGSHHFESVPACQFSVFVSDGHTSGAHVLSTVRPATLRAWNWDLPVGAGQYHALYPKAWFTYDWDTLPVGLAQRQFSPVLPHNYRESSYPVALFEWTVDNPGPNPVTVGLMFSWQNLVGRWASMDRLGGHVNRTVRKDGLVGVEMTGPASAAREPWAGSFAIVSPEEPGVTLTVRDRFSVDGDGADIWSDFASDGHLEPGSDRSPSRPGEAIGAAVAATVDLQPGEQRSISFALAWDFPLVEFGSGRRWHPRYTRYFGTEGRAAWAIAAEGLARQAEWETEIDAWQSPILAADTRPGWYKQALFNELYFMVDGGTAWLDPSEGASDQEQAGSMGRFALLECFDYPFYNTLDVYFYASFALVMLWPALALQMIRDYVETVDAEDSERVLISGSGEQAPRKVRGSVPHDVGGPPADPFLTLNHYQLRDVSRWKDLNCKFVLLAWQCVELLEDTQLATDAWPSVLQALRYIAAFDTDGDGLPEHDGEPDQTYDTWPMRGASAYGSGLWIASLLAGIELARRAGDPESETWLADLVERAVAARDDKLWTGAYYRYDSSDGPSSDSIMADQLAGQWWADATRLGDVAPPAAVEKALLTIFRHNVLGFANGTMGAVNGSRPDGSVDESSEQSAEMWIGTTYALAAFMLSRGLDREAWQTAEGAARVTYERGYWFRTPEAVDAAGNFRATMYLRPLAIWAIEHALRQRGE